jgi:hypothetical protein
MKIIIILLAPNWKREMPELGKKERMKNGEGLKLLNAIGESKKKKDDARPRTSAMKRCVPILKNIRTTGESRMSDELQNPPDPPEAQFGRR